VLPAQQHSSTSQLVPPKETSEQIESPTVFSVQQFHQMMTMMFCLCDFLKEVILLVSYGVIYLYLIHIEPQPNKQEENKRTKSLNI